MRIVFLANFFILFFFIFYDIFKKNYYTYKLSEGR